MKILKTCFAFMCVAVLTGACGESNSLDKTKDVTESQKQTSDTAVKKEMPNEGVNVSIKGASIDLGSEGGKVETKTGTDIQVNKKGLR